MTGGVDPLLYARARQLISERTGFRDDAIAPETLERVVGADINEGSLATARRATYGAWSRRESGPHLFPLYRPLEDRQVTIFETVRTATTFMVANLLAPVDAVLGQFHFILCRNVLTYF